MEREPWWLADWVGALVVILIFVGAMVFAYFALMKPYLSAGPGPLQ